VGPFKDWKKRVQVATTESASSQPLASDHSCSGSATGSAKTTLPSSTGSSKSSSSLFSDGSHCSKRTHVILGSEEEDPGLSRLSEHEGPEADYDEPGTLGDATDPRYLLGPGGTTLRTLAPRPVSTTSIYYLIADSDRDYRSSFSFSGHTLRSFLPRPFQRFHHLLSTLHV
jgi:hypothetical protein